MPSIREISDFTGFARDSITTRTKRFGLDLDKLTCKQVLQLIPLDEDHGIRRSLEEERANNTRLDSQLKQIQIEKLEGKLADVDELLAATNELHDGIAAIIRSSDLGDDEKGDIFSRIQDFGKGWGERMG